MKVSLHQTYKILFSEGDIAENSLWMDQLIRPFNRIRKSRMVKTRPVMSNALLQKISQNPEETETPDHDFVNKGEKMHSREKE